MNLLKNQNIISFDFFYNFVTMKMQHYIRIVLSFILIFSNLSVAFSMHLCQGEIEDIKLNHFKTTCKMQKPIVSCCEEKEEVERCELPTQKEANKDDDCCKDLAYNEDLQVQQKVDVLKVSPLVFIEFSAIQITPFSEEYLSYTTNYFLDFYVESNAPPIYIINRQLVFYEG